MQHYLIPIEALTKQTKARRSVPAVGFALAAGLAAWVIYFFLTRESAALATLCGGLAGCVAMFVWLTQITPKNAWLRMLYTLRDSRNHTERYEFTSYNEDINTQQGVPCHAAHFLNGRDDRLLFWPHALPFPEFAPGQPLDVTFCGHFILELKCDE
ncbi:MAG: hypothetical protein FWD16_01105 [Clostridia bacterium]|nr:hypothetical protein [Clostridia bacterium]